jgi:hypothetical protein
VSRKKYYTKNFHEISEGLKDALNGDDLGYKLRTTGDMISNDDYKSQRVNTLQQNKEIIIKVI